MLCGVEHEKSFITSGPGIDLHHSLITFYKAPLLCHHSSTGLGKKEYPVHIILISAQNHMLRVFIRIHEKIRKIFKLLC